MAIKSYEELSRDIKNKIYHPVYLLQGDEAFYINTAANRIDAYGKFMIINICHN